MWDCLIVIDRDGTLIENYNYLGKEDDWHQKIQIKEKTINKIKNLEAKYTHALKIVFTNQTGVALGFFSEKRVQDINMYVSNLLKEKNLYIDYWIYSPEADLDYAKMKGITPNIYVKKNSTRKPNPKLLISLLQSIGLTLQSFKSIYVIGDSEDDRQLANRLNADFIIV